MFDDEKFVAKLFWMEKGHLTNSRTMQECAEGYFKRAWGNHELCYHEEGFEQAYAIHLKKNEKNAK